MIHPSYKELMNAVNNDAPEGEPIVHSRYSIVMGAAKRARQLVAADHCYYNGEPQKALSIAVAELENGEIHIVSEGSEEADIQARMPGMYTSGRIEHDEAYDEDGEELEEGEESADSGDAENEEEVDEDEIEYDEDEEPEHPEEQY